MGVSKVGTIQENIQYLHEFAYGECDGSCDEKPPYKRCAKHTAVDALNEASEILSRAVDEIGKRMGRGR